MGISKLLGFSKKGKSKDTKVKKLSQVSLEVNSLRGIIDAENRENFPNLAHYKEIYKDVQALYRILDTMIVNKDHTDDALRMRDDLKKKLDALGAKIKRNLK
jgi:hypothetical protein